MIAFLESVSLISHAKIPPLAVTLPQLQHHQCAQQLVKPTSYAVACT